MEVINVDMTKRELKALLAQFERLDATENVYVSQRISKYLTTFRETEKSVVVFCLASVPLSDPILHKIKEWILEANAISHPASSAHMVTQIEAYIAKVCGNCGTGGKLKTCDRCRLTRYCGQACQSCDWKKHKTTCRKPAESSTSVTRGDTTVVVPADVLN